MLQAYWCLNWLKEGLPKCGDVVLADANQVGLELWNERNTDERRPVARHAAAAVRRGLTKLRSV